VAGPFPGGIPHPPTPVFRRTTNVAVFVIVGVIVAIVAMVTIVSLLTPFGMFGFAPFCGFFAVFIAIIVIAVIAAATRGFGGGSRLPPPPPIQQPMVPAGMQGPVALNCPNCGAPPQSVDRFGVATCTYCNTKFLVR
jgi:hypothetical protein